MSLGGLGPDVQRKELAFMFVCVYTYVYRTGVHVRFLS